MCLSLKRNIKVSTVSTYIAKYCSTLKTACTSQFKQRTLSIQNDPDTSYIHCLNDAQYPDIAATYTSALLTIVAQCILIVVDKPRFWQPYG